MQMHNKKIGSQTVKFDNPPKIIATHSIVGPKEGQGPLSEYFDEILDDDTLGKDSFEKAESQMMFTAITKTLQKAKLKETAFHSLDYMEHVLLCQNP